MFFQYLHACVYWYTITSFINDNCYDLHLDLFDSSPILSFRMMKLSTIIVDNFIILKDSIGPLLKIGV